MTSPPSEKARLFVAMDLPDEAREAVVEWRQRALGGVDGLRLVDPAALHMTLVFLGHLPAEEIERVGSLMRAAVPAMEAPVLTNQGLKAVPPRRPRLFALDLADEDGRAGRVQAAVSGALEDAGLYEPEKRPFWPHVTLARVRSGRRVGKVDAAPAPEQPWRASAVTLYRSRLSRAGARYEPLAQVAL